MVSPIGHLGAPVVYARVLETARDAGLDGDSLRELQGHTAWTERAWIWARIMRAVRVDAFPIRVAQRFSISEVGPLGLVAQVAPDLRSAFQRLTQHQHVMTGTTLVRVRDDAFCGTTILELLPVEGSGLGARCRREMMIASAVMFARNVSGIAVRPRRVCFRHGEPRDSSEHETFFDCDLRFDAGYDGLEFDRDTMAIPLARADADLSQFLVEHLRAMAGDPPATVLEGRVRWAIRGRLGKQTLTMSAVARDLGMSPRTLRRHLIKHGISYHEILDRVRCEAAAELLGGSVQRLSDIAFLLGFSDASTFHRAYVRWTGRTPGTRRRQETPE